MYNFEGKNAMVSGVAQGIGKACALRLAKEGANIALIDLPAKDGSIPENYQATADEIEAMGRKVLICPTDVSNKEQVVATCKKIQEEFKTVDMMVNVAGVGWLCELDLLTEEQWDRTVDIDMKGNFLMQQAMAPFFREQKFGHIVNIASIVGVTSDSGNLMDYNAAKAGVINLTQSFARHLGPYGINVNAVDPGYVWTPMWMVTDRWLWDHTFPDEEYIPKKMHETVLMSECLQRETYPKDIANVVAWLCSDESSEVTGQHINVDGGVEFH